MQYMSCSASFAAFAAGISAVNSKLLMSLDGLRLPQNIVREHEDAPDLIVSWLALFDFSFVL